MSEIGGIESSLSRQGVNLSTVGMRILLALLLSSPAGGTHALTLTTGSGDGRLIVDVDGFGLFGSAIGPSASDAFYDPGGSIEQAGTGLRAERHLASLTCGVFLARIRS